MLLSDTTSTIVIVEHQIPPEQAIGSLKQGLMCLPSGKIKVFQLRIPSPDTLLKEVRQKSLWLSDEQLHGVIKKLDVSLCTSWMGIASTKPKGKISVEISWRRTLSGADQEFCVASGKISFDGDDPRTSESPMLAAIGASLASAKKCIVGGSS
mgnify:CR=1 FL=1